MVPWAWYPAHSAPQICPCEVRPAPGWPGPQRCHVLSKAMVAPACPRPPPTSATGKEQGSEPRQE